jgi:ABC-2 type transport system ATP-binding protein
MQRLGIAQAQINEPDLLILDEPASALDPMGREQVLVIMEQLRERATIFYSTHILDDVQRVSDRVAVLDRGQLIAQGPIEALLNGGDGVVYSLVTRSAPANLEAPLRSQPWVSSLTVSQVDGLSSWQVGISDDQAAEEKLLRLVLADERVRVIEYGREKVELEDVFMQLVKKGHQNDN